MMLLVNQSLGKAGQGPRRVLLVVKVCYIGTKEDEEATVTGWSSRNPEEVGVPEGGSLDDLPAKDHQKGFEPKP